MERRRSLPRNAKFDNEKDEWKAIINHQQDVGKAVDNMERNFQRRQKKDLM